MVWLDNSRIVAIFAVVLLHVAVDVVIGAELGSPYWWIGNFYLAMVQWCVPVFVMISGALLLNPTKTESLEEFYKKRASRVLIPLVFWSAMFVLWNLLKGIYSGKHPTTWSLIKTLISGTPHYHMWFLYMIVILYLFTPFFRKIAYNSTRRDVFILVIICFTLAALNYIFIASTGRSKLFVNWFLLYVPYFFSGYLLSGRDVKFPASAATSLFLISIFFTAIGCYFLAVHTNLSLGTYFYGNLSVTIIPMSISLMFLLKLWNAPIISDTVTKKLSALTLGVYLIHPMVLETINHFGYRPLYFQPTLSIIIIALLVYLISLAGAWFISKIPYIRRTI